jgi:hypothetical protein
VPSAKKLVSFNADSTKGNTFYILCLQIEGYTQEEIAFLLHTSRFTVRNICVYAEMYNCLPADDTTSLLHEEELHFVRELVQSCPNLYLDEYVSALNEQFGASVSIVSMHRVLNTLGHS